MKLRHAAAIGLVGWYLLIPPYSPELKAPDTTKPYIYWLRLGKFDSADQCEADRRYMNGANFRISHAATQGLGDTGQRLAASECIEQYDLVF